MTISDYSIHNVRLCNTETLRDAVGNNIQFAESIGKYNTQVASWLRDNKAKLIGDTLARDIEASAGKEKYWLDEIHSEKKFQLWLVKHRACLLSVKLKAMGKQNKLTTEIVDHISKVLSANG